MPDTNTCIIRPARSADVPGVLEIYNDAVLHTTAVYTYDPLTLQMMQQWYKDKTEKNLPVFVAEASSPAAAPAASPTAPATSPTTSIAGFATYGPFRPWPAYQYTVEHSIYVHKDFRGQGLAKKLLQTLIDHATAAHLHTIVAGIDSENAVSINLHQQFGFREVGSLAQVGYKFDRWLDLKFMQLILPKNV